MFSVIHIGWKCQLNGTGNFRKKDNLEGLTKTFEKNFRKLSVQFVFEPEFSVNFVRMKRAHSHAVRLQKVDSKTNQANTQAMT